MGGERVSGRMMPWRRVSDGSRGTEAAVLRLLEMRRVGGGRSVGGGVGGREENVSVRAGGGEFGGAGMWDCCWICVAMWFGFKGSWELFSGMFMLPYTRRRGRSVFCHLSSRSNLFSPANWQTWMVDGNNGHSEGEESILNDGVRLLGHCGVENKKTKADVKKRALEKS